MDGIAFISVEDFFLLLQGWRESKSRLRVKFLSPSLKFSAFCELLDARDGRVAFWIGHPESKSAADFNVTGCLFGFRDVAASEAGLPEGVIVESAIEAVRDDFGLLIMLLSSD